MRDVMTELEAWWRAGESVGVGTVVGTWKSAPRQPGASMLVGPEGTAVGQRLGRLRRGRGLRAGRGGARGRRTGPAALRRQRRRRVRRRPDLRRHHRHLRRAGEPGHLPRTGRCRTGHPRWPPGGRRDADQRRRAAASGPSPDRARGRCVRLPRQRPAGRRGPRRRPRHAAAGPDRHRPLRPRRRAARRRHRGVRRLLRARGRA